MRTPIHVLVRADADSYSPYLAEMLRVESLSWFAAHPDPPCEPPQLVIAAAQDLAGATAERLAAYVRAGGSLLACRPSAALLAALDLPPAPPLPEEWSSRYVLLEPVSPIVHNLPWVPTGVQFFGRPIALPVNPNEPDPLAVPRIAPF